MWQLVLLLGSEVSGYATLGLTPGDKGLKFFSNCRVQRRLLIGGKAAFPLGIRVFDRDWRSAFLPGFKITPVTQDRRIESIAISRLRVFGAKK